MDHRRVQPSNGDSDLYSTGAEKLFYADVERNDDHAPGIVCMPLALLVKLPKDKIARTFCASCLMLKQIVRCVGTMVSGTANHAEGQLVPDLTANITSISSRPFAISPCCDLYKRESRSYGTVVIRRIRFQDDETLGEGHLKKIALTLLKAQGAHVLPYLGTCDFEGSLCIVSPLAQGGDLKTYLLTHPDCDRRNLVRQVVHGLEYLHCSGVIHGNLHTRNVLLSEDQTVRLSDFGLSEVIPDEGTTSMRSAFCREKAMHRAPETHMGEPLAPSSDVYSVGMLAFHVYADKEVMIGLFPGAIQAAAALMSGRRPGRGEITREDFTEDLWGTVQWCWAHDKEKRPTAAEVLADLADTKRMPAHKNPLSKGRKSARDYETMS
ncbi:kinase-like protein [Auricularia subglabra TFB-10046 SS5]|nr:kinase-like protein [Auricularia subglabra TFB-10046 SS5]